MRKLPVISPTQVSTWRLCNRKFAFTYLADLPRPAQTKAQLIGVALHDKVDQLIKTGFPDYTFDPKDEASKEAARLLSFVETKIPRLATLSEQKVTVNLDGVEFGGRFDWLHYYAGKAELGDLKTTSNLKYAKTAPELSIDPQVLIYSQGQTSVKPEHVFCRWVYVQTKGHPHVHEVRVEPDFSALPELVQDGKMIVAAWEERQAGSALNPNHFEPNTSACDAFGGCPFRSRCYIDPGERLESLQKRLGLLTENITMGKQLSFEEMMAQANGIEDVAVNPPVLRHEEKELPQVLDPAAVVAESVAASEAVFAAAKPKRTRKPKDTDPAPAPVTDEKPIGTLFLSCCPVGQVYEGLEHVEYIVAAVRADINQKANVEDYRLMPYGTGAGALVAGVEERVKEIRPRALYVDVRSPEGRILAGPLMALATQTFQGT